MQFKGNYLACELDRVSTSTESSVRNLHIWQALIRDTRLASEPRFKVAVFRSARRDVSRSADLRARASFAGDLHELALSWKWPC